MGSTFSKLFSTNVPQSGTTWQWNQPIRDGTTVNDRQAIASTTVMVASWQIILLPHPVNKIGANIISSKKLCCYWVCCCRCCTYSHVYLTNITVITCCNESCHWCGKAPDFHCNYSYVPDWWKLLLSILKTRNSLITFLHYLILWCINIESRRKHTFTEWGRESQRTKGRRKLWIITTSDSIVVHAAPVLN